MSIKSNAIMKAEKPHHFKYYTLGLIAITVLIFIIFFLNSLYMTHHIAAHLIPFMDTVMNIEREITVAHIKNEGIGKEGKAIEIKDIDIHLDLAEMHSRILLEGGQFLESEFRPLDDFFLNRKIKDLLERIIRFRENVRDKFKNGNKSPANSETSQSLKANLKSLIEVTYQVKASLLQVIESYLKRYKTIQGIIAAALLILAVINSFILYRYKRIRKLEKEELQNRMNNLQREKEYSQTIIKNSNAIIVGLDKDNMIKLFNEEAENISGYKCAEVLDKNWFKIFFPPEIYEEMDQVWKEAWGSKSHSYINPIRIKDGSKRIISWRSSGMYNSKNVNDHLLISIGEDITGRMDMITKLQKSQNFNETLLNTVPDIIYIFDISEKRNVYINNRIFTVLGYTVKEVKELAEKLLPMLMHPEDYKIYLEDTHLRYQEIKDNEFIEHESRLKHKNGEWRWLCTKESIYLRNKYGEAAQIFGVAQDITERKHTEEKLKESRENLRQSLAVIESILDSTVNGILVTDLDGKIIHANRRFLEIWSIPDEVLESGNGNSLMEYFQSQSINPDDFINSVHSIYENPETETIDILELKDGKLIERYTIPHQLDNKIIGSVWSFRDITEEIKTKLEIIEERNWLISVINSIPYPTLVVNYKREIQICNPAFTEVFGYNSKEVIGKSTCILYPDKESFLRTGTERYNMKSSPDKEKYSQSYKRKNGDIFPSETIGVSVKDEAGNVIGYIGIIRDITDDLRREKEKRILEDQLIHAQKMESIGRLAGGIAHDFNNILASIMGYAELLSLKLPDSPASEKNAARIIYQGAIRASDLTKQLLGFARAGKYNPVPLDLNKLIKEVVYVSEKIFEKKVTISYDLDKNLNVVEADKGQLDQILTNLIINSRDAMPEGGTLTFKTENVRLDDDYTCQFPEFTSGDYVKISVIDSGIGMPLEIRKKIFDPFFTTKGEGKGTGLGLATVYGIVKNHGGHIIVSSESGEGTTFTIFLPVSEKELVESQAETENVMGNATILLVDDEEHVREVASDMLQQLGYKILSAKNGKEAVSIYLKKEDKIDLILLDIIMPIMDGKETYHQLKKINPNVNVVVTSGYTESNKAMELIALGAAGILPKPFSLNELSKSVANALA